jgi:hypothetical protein
MRKLGATFLYLFLCSAHFPFQDDAKPFSSHRLPSGTATGHPCIQQAFIKSAPVTRTTSALRTEERGMKPGTSLLELMLFCSKQIKLLSATRGQIELGAIKAGDTRGPGKGRDTYDISKDVQPRLRS